MQQTLDNGTTCPSCGQTVQHPLHACHVIRDNYPVNDNRTPQEWQEIDDLHRSWRESATTRER